MRHYHIHRTPRLTPDWALAEVLTDFSFPWEDRQAPATEFRALWDAETFFFRFDCVDHDFVLSAGETLKERVLGSDRVEIFITPDLSLKPYYCFEMSPRCEALAYRGNFHRQFDWQWTCPELALRASIAEQRYQVEGSLPLATLRALDVLKADTQEFYAGVFRGEFRHLEDGSVQPGWMPWCDPKTEKPDFHVPAAFGVFEFVA